MKNKPIFLVVFLLIFTASEVASSNEDASLTDGSDSNVFSSIGLRGRALEEMCPICSDLLSYENNAIRCSQKIRNVNAKVGKAHTFFKTRNKLAAEARKVVAAKDPIENVWDVAGPIVKNIPYVGKAVNLLVGTVIPKVLGFLKPVTKDSKPLNKMESGLKQTKDKLAKLDKKVTQSKTYAENARLVLNTLYSLNAKGECISPDYTQFTQKYSSALIQEASSKMAECADLDLSPFDAFETLFDAPEVPDLSPLPEMASSFSDAFSWIEEMMQHALNQADYEACCTQHGQFFAAFGDFFVDLIDVLSCPFDGLADAVAQEAVEAIDLPFMKILSAWNELVDEQNRKIEGLNEAINALTDIPLFPNVSLEVTKCTITFVNVPGSIAAPAFTLPLMPSFVPEPCRSDDGVEESCEMDRDINFDAIGNTIADTCNDAAADLGGADDIDCCPAARVNYGNSPDGWDVGHKCTWNIDCINRRCQGPAGNKYCSDGTAGSSCWYGDSNTHCNIGLMCRDGKCGKGGKNYDKCDKAWLPCAFGFECIGSNVCSNGKSGSYCESINDCNGDLTCHNNECKAKFSLGVACSKDNHCQSDDCVKPRTGGAKVCSDGSFGQACYNTSDCKSDYKCYDGKCGYGGKNGSSRCNEVPFPCAEGYDCRWPKSGGKYCSNGSLNTYCNVDTGDDQCKSGLTCLDHKCKYKLGQGASCSRNDHCKSNRCQVGKCADGNIGSTCNYTNDKHCNGNLVCYNGKCSNGGVNWDKCDKAWKPCYKLNGYNCRGSLYCSNGAGGSYCKENSHCDSGFYCNGEKKCVAKLGTKAKCTVDSQCKNNKCRGLDGKKECSDGGNGHTCYYESHCQNSYRCSKRSDGYKRCIPKLGLKQKCSAHSECSNNNCRGGKEHTKECSNGDRGHTCYYTDRDCNGSLKCKWVGNDYKRCEN